MATRKRARPRRARPGTGRGGEYYRIEVRPKRSFVTFRYHDVGRPGHVLRLAGQREAGSWDDVAWLISKKDAHVEAGRLVADTAGARRILESIGPAQRIKGNVFKGKAK